MRDPLPLTLGFDEVGQQRMSDADYALGRLSLAARSLRDPREVLVRPTRESEVESISGLRGQVLTRRHMASGQYDVNVPYDFDLYTQVMTELADAPASEPVSVLLQVAARGLSGMDDESGEVDQLPWRASEWSFARLLGAKVVPDVEPEVLPARMHQLSQWIDAGRLPIAVRVAVGLYELIELDPFTNTLELLHVYATLELRRTGRLDLQVLPFSVFFLRNQDRFRDAFQHVGRTGDYNPWLLFVADCIIERATKHVDLALDLSQLPDVLEQRIDHLPRRDAYSRLLRLFPRFQFLTTDLVADGCHVTAKHARDLLHRAERDGFVTLIGDSRRNKTYEVVEVRNLILRDAGVVRDIDSAAVRDID